MNDATLANWVREGRKLHKDTIDKCGFCGNNLPTDLIDKLDKHFNQESEDLITSIDDILKDIKIEKTRVPNLLKIKNSYFYSNFTQDLDALVGQLEMYSTGYLASLEAIKKQLEKRRDDIFNPILFDEPVSVEDNLNKVRISYEELRSKSNKFTASLSTEQTNARESLRLHDIFRYITNINYKDESETIQVLEKEKGKAQINKDTAEEEVDTKQTQIDDLKSQLKDEHKGADQVNEYLNNFFGHKFLSLRPIR